MDQTVQTMSAHGITLAEAFMLLHISYVSTLYEADDASRIVAEADAANRRLGIGGCIAFAENQCVQIIEGECDEVEALFERIKRDKRHFGIVELVRMEIPAPRFTDWGMVRWPLADVYALSEARARRSFRPPDNGKP